MTLLLSTLSTPIGSLNLIADEHVLLAANLSSLKALKESLSQEDSERDIKSVSRIPIISDLISDYFDGDISAMDAIHVRQPGASFSQAACEKEAPGWRTLIALRAAISPSK